MKKSPPKPQVIIPGSDLLELDHFLKKKTGFQITSYRPSLIRRRIQKRLRDRDCQGVSEYTKVLKTDPDELPQLLSVLTINVSWFFRDPSLFRFLKEKLFAKLIGGLKGKSSPLRVLSVGCALGEEPYSLALLVKDLGLEKHVRICGVDIDQEAIGKAKKGLYTLSQIGEVPSFLRDRYFSKRQDKWQINEIIAKMVSFKHLDLLSAPALPKSDLILCRNLLIYFDREQQVNLIKFLHGILKKRGFLILGKSEILLGKRKEGFGTFNSKERIYKKI